MINPEDLNKVDISYSELTLPSFHVGDKVYVKPDVAELHKIYTKGSYVWVNQPSRLKFLDGKPHTITLITHDGQYVLDNDIHIMWIADDFILAAIHPDDIVIDTETANQKFPPLNIDVVIKESFAQNRQNQTTFHPYKLGEYLSQFIGMTVYHVMFGDVTIKSVSDKCITIVDSTKEKHILRTDGRYIENGDVLIYPSREHRSWSDWWEENIKPTIVYKTWSELSNKLTEIPMIAKVNVGENVTPQFVFEDSTLLPPEKGALALIKILALIKHSYGGLVTPDELDSSELKLYTITKDRFTDTVGIVKCNTQCPIMFHTREQAKEFLSYPENLFLFYDFLNSCVWDTE